METNNENVKEYRFDISCFTKAEKDPIDLIVKINEALYDGEMEIVMAPIPNPPGNNYAPQDRSHPHKAALEWQDVIDKLINEYLVTEDADGRMYLDAQINFAQSMQQRYYITRKPH